MYEEWGEVEQSVSKCGKFWQFCPDKNPAEGGGKVLIGEYNQTIDAKGRVNVPSKFREELGGSFVVSKGLDNCVCVYPKDEWERFKAELDTVPASKRRMLSRFFFSGAEECDTDSQGRVLIPPKIREYAGLNKEIVVVGMSDKVEIWDRSSWENYMDNPAFDAEEIAKAMEELGI